MRKERRNLTGEFKAKVALEALSERKTIGQLVAEYELQSNQITAWKKLLLENSAKVFEPDLVKPNPEIEKKITELYNQIGKLTMENEWLKKKSD